MRASPRCLLSFLGLLSLIGLLSLTGDLRAVVFFADGNANLSIDGTDQGRIDSPSTS